MSQLQKTTAYRCPACNEQVEITFKKPSYFQPTSKKFHCSLCDSVMMLTITKDKENQTHVAHKFMSFGIEIESKIQKEIIMKRKEAESQEP